MSSHKIQYRIYADDLTDHTNDEWARADRYINGLAYSSDLGEAFAMAKKAALNCKFPFIVMAVLLPNRNNLFCDTWVFEK